MISRARRGAGQGGPRADSNRRRPASKAVVGVETLEGRTLLSYLVVTKNRQGRPHPYRRRPRQRTPVQQRPGIQASGPFLPVLHRAAAARAERDQSERAGLREPGEGREPDPVRHGGRAHHPESDKPRPVVGLRVRDRPRRRRGTGADPGPSEHPLRHRGRRRHQATERRPVITAYYQLNDPSTNQPGTLPAPATTPATLGNRIHIPASLGRRDRRSYHNDHRPAHFDSSNTTPTFSSGTNLLTSSGKAIDQWNVNFFTRNPTQKPNFQSVASFTPEFTDFQVFVPQPHYHQP